MKHERADKLAAHTSHESLTVGQTAPVLRTSHPKERGSILILSAILLVVLLGFGALAIDVGRLMVVRNELQNAADASAMAGAGCLFTRTECGNLNHSTPDWNTASLRAQNFIPNNAAEGIALTDGLVEYGYWNITGSPAGLQPTNITPGTNDRPAIKVTITKENGKNGGPVSMALAAILGVVDSDVTASAVAVVTHAGGVGLFPVVIDKCLYDNYWDPVTGMPKLATSVIPPYPDMPPQIIGQPYIFKVTSSYHATTPCEAGQWSSLDTKSNSANYLQNLITTGNTSPISVGDNVWISTGTMNTPLYSAVQACSSTGNKNCEYVKVALVSGLNTGSWEPVIGFSCMRIYSATGGSGKYIVMQMSDDPTKCNNLGTGPVTETTTPPRLAS